MKLAILVTHFPCVTETFIARDVAEFVRRGHDVRIFQLSPPQSSAVVHEFVQPLLPLARTIPFLLGRPTAAALAKAVWQKRAVLTESVQTIVRRCWREPGLLAKSLAIVPKSLAFAEQIEAWGADHIHAEFAGHPATAAWIIGRVTGIPYSVSCRAHDIFITQSMLEEKLAGAAFVRTISHYNAQFLSERLHALDRRKIVVIHSSVDLHQIRPELAVPHPGFRMLYVGSLETRKGVGVLLDALSRARLGSDWHCDIVGDGPLRKRLEKQAQRLGLSRRVTFWGEQTFGAICEKYRAADVVIVPSIVGPRGRTEGIPNVVIEALAHLRPVIATRVSGIPELVRDGETGLLVPPGDADAVARALECVKNEPAAAAAMASAGRALVEESFDLRRNVEAQLVMFAAHVAKRTPDGLRRARVGQPLARRRGDGEPKQAEAK